MIENIRICKVKNGWEIFTGSFEFYGSQIYVAETQEKLLSLIRELTEDKNLAGLAAK